MIGSRSVGPRGLRVLQEPVVDSRSLDVGLETQLHQSLGAWLGHRSRASAVTGVGKGGAGDSQISLRSSSIPRTGPSHQDRRIPAHGGRTREQSYPRKLDPENDQGEGQREG